MDPVRGQDGKADPGKEDEATRVRVDGSDRLRVLEAVGFTSGTFIGPALPPSRTGPDIEETLSEFYKELQDLDTLDGADDNSGRPGSPSPPPSASVVFLPLQPPEIASVQWKCDPVQEWTRRPPEAELCLHGDERKQSPWPHWYNNEPYQQRRPRSNLHPDPERVATTPQQWRQRQSVGRPRPPPPRSLRPRFHRPPPPAAVPYSQSPPPPLPPRMDQDWGASVGTNPYEEEPGFLAFPHTPPPSFHSHPSVRPHVDSRCYFNQHQQDYYDYDDAPSSSSSGGGWAPGENEGRYQWAVEPDPRDQRCPPAHEDSALVLILLRGLPGSGKSTLARELMFTGPSGLILSTDDYFLHTDGYHYELNQLGAAHEWNQNRAEDAMRDGRSPIIIDNTNIQAWEMKPYVCMALERGYRVDFCEPDTAWKFDPRELERRNKHGVPQEKIAQMLDRFSFPISVDIVMNSQEPPHVNRRHRQ